jgi:hypothetical protein
MVLSDVDTVTSMPQGSQLWDVVAKPVQLVLPAATPPITFFNCTRVRSSGPFRFNVFNFSFFMSVKIILTVARLPVATKCWFNASGSLDASLEFNAVRRRLDFTAENPRKYETLRISL